MNKVEKEMFKKLRAAMRDHRRRAKLLKIVEGGSALELSEYLNKIKIAEGAAE